MKSIYPTDFRYPPEIHAIAHGLVEELRTRHPQYNYHISPRECEISIEHNTHRALIYLNGNLTIWLETWTGSHHNLDEIVTIEYADPNLIELTINEIYKEMGPT